MTVKSPEEFEKFDKAMDKIMSVSKEELARRLSASFDWRNQERPGIRTTIADSGTDESRRSIKFMSRSSRPGTRLALGSGCGCLLNLSNDYKVVCECRARRAPAGVVQPSPYS